MWRHHLRIWRLWDENVLFFGIYWSVCETEAYRKVLITLVNLLPKAKKEAEHSITPPRMTCTSRVDKLEKMEKAAVTQSLVTGYIFSPKSSVRGVILISHECWSCKLLNDLTPQQCISRRLNLLHNHLFPTPPRTKTAALGNVWEGCTWRNTMRLVRIPVFGKSFPHLLLTLRPFAIVENVLSSRSFYWQMSLDAAECKVRLGQLDRFVACLTL